MQISTIQIHIHMKIRRHWTKKIVLLYINKNANIQVRLIFNKISCIYIEFIKIYTNTYEYRTVEAT